LAHWSISLMYGVNTILSYVYNYNRQPIVRVIKQSYNYSKIYIKNHCTLTLSQGTSVYVYNTYTYIKQFSAFSERVVTIYYELYDEKCSNNASLLQIFPPGYRSHDLLV
jgi:hypothetical protein